MISALRFFLFFIAVIAMPHYATAQDAPETSPAKQTAGEEKAAPTPLHEQATDKQIKEAQAYYNFCSNNESMNKIRDCKCSAVAYLEARVMSGNKPKEADILNMIKNSCLQDDGRYGQSESTDDDDDEVSQLTDKELEEIKMIYETCKADHHMRTFQDCECVASRFMEERQRQGPIRSDNNILLSLRNECKNSVDAAGHAYTDCMSNPMVSSFSTAPKATLCECVARSWVTRFENYQGEISSKMRVNFASGALLECANKLQ